MTSIKDPIILKYYGFFYLKLHDDLVVVPNVFHKHETLYFLFIVYPVQKTLNYNKNIKYRKNCINQSSVTATDINEPLYLSVASVFMGSKLNMQYIWLDLVWFRKIIIMDLMGSINLKINGPDLHLISLSNKR